MRDENDRAVEIVDERFEHGHRLEVEVVRRLVEEQHVRRLHEDAQEVQSAFLAARQPCDRCPLEVAGKKEALHELRRGNGRAIRERDRARGLLDVLDGAQALVQQGGLLCEIADFHRLPDRHRAARRLQAAGDEVQERRLARAVAAEDGDAVVAQDGVGEILHDRLAADLVMDVVELDDRAAEAAARETDLHRAAVEVGRLRLHLLIALDARFLLRRARLRAAP